ncbi:S1C family serine protease [Candidatus Pelagibacter ubique]|nr:S1C family serine protease [Candidatus Pelagibacter ubique]
MKKILGIIVLGFLLIGNAYALTVQGAINQYLAGKKLEGAEGIWVDNEGIVEVITKSGNEYRSFRIRGGNAKSGSFQGSFQGSSGNYYGYAYVTGFFGRKKCNLTIQIYGNSGTWSCGGFNYDITRTWPNDISQHNAKLEEKKKPKLKEKEKKKKVTGASGTAFFITEKGHLITNNHVVEVCNDNSKIVYSGKDISAKVLASDALLDLALLKTDLKKTKFIHLSDDPPKKLQRIIAAGYPLGKSLSDDLKFTSGIISSLKGLNDDSTLIQIDAALNKGNSGGPIINEETAELVAVAVAGLDKSSTEAINFGIKTNSLRNFLDSNQIELPTKSLFSFGVDAANILEKATVYTYCKN